MKTAEAADNAPQKVTVYKLTNTMTSGNEYLIVNRNSAGSGYALTRTTRQDDQVAGRSAVTVQGNTGTYYDKVGANYIEAGFTGEADSVWQVVSDENNNQHMWLKNDKYSLLVTGGSLNGDNPITITDKPISTLTLDETFGETTYDNFSWNYTSNNNLQITFRRNNTYDHNGNHTKYIVYNNNNNEFQGTASANGNNARIYIYQKLEICLSHDYKYQDDLSLDVNKWVMDEHMATAHASFKCETCGEVQTVDAVVTGVTTSADCTSTPQITFTATISAAESLDGKEHTKVFDPVTLQVKDTETEKIKIYVLTDSISSGKNYLIVDSNTDGNAHAIANGDPKSVVHGSSTDIAVIDKLVKVEKGVLEGYEGDQYYIKYSSAEAIWSVRRSNNDRYWYFTNDGYYLKHFHGQSVAEDDLILYLSKASDDYRRWYAGADYLRYQNDNNTNNATAFYYVNHKDSSKWSLLTRVLKEGNSVPEVPSKSHVYFYEEIEIDAYKGKNATAGQHTLGSRLTREEPTCTTDGHVAGYECSVCKKHFENADGTGEIANEDWVLPAKHTLGSLLTREEPTCDEDGHVAGYECSVCKKHFENADGTGEIANEDWVLPAKHTLGSLLTREEPTCTTDGHVAGYECSECKKHFENADGTGEIAKEDWVLPAKHTLGSLLTRVEPTCTTDGHVAGYECSVCKKHFSDAEGKTEIAENSWILHDEDAHDWEFAGFEWTDDGSGEYTKVEAKYICKNNEKHIVPDEVTVERIEKPATETGCAQIIWKVSVTANEARDGKLHEEERSVNLYSVKFVDEDGTVLKEELYRKNTKKEKIEKPDDPETVVNAQYTIEFTGWSPEITDVTQNAVYKATYKTTTNKYKVTFVGADGSTVLQEAEVEFGVTPKYDGKTPTKEDETSVYTFSGWTPEITSVSGTAVYKATFTSTPKKYTVKFVNDDGTELQSGEVEYGATPKYDGKEPTKAADKQSTYTFDKWTPEISTVEKEITYTATYTKTVNKYTITWKNGDTN